MHARRIALATVLATGCATVGRREAEDVLWVRVTPDGVRAFATRYHAYDPGRYSIDPCWCVGYDGDVVLFTTRVQSSPSAFACVSGHRFWHDRDVVGYEPTGRVADPRTPDGREWREYRQLGGPDDAPRVREAISKQRSGRLDRPR